MGRGRMGPSSSGGSSRGGSSFGGGRGMGGGPVGGGRPMRHRHTTVIIGGHGHHGWHYSGGSPWVGIIVGAIFVIVGLFIMFGGFGQLFSSFNYDTVQAECVLNEKSGMWYYTTYDYTVDGKDYTNRSMQSWEFPEEVGKVVTIYYLKSDPNKIYEEKPVDKSGAGIMIFAGILCAGIGAVPLVLSIKTVKAIKSSGSNGNDGGTISSTPKEETPNRCPYCGSRYSKNSDSCPKCGASKMD